MRESLLQLFDVKLLLYGLTHAPLDGTVQASQDHNVAIAALGM